MTVLLQSTSLMSFGMHSDSDEEPQWSVFSDPLEKFTRFADIRSDGRTVRQLEDIGLNEEDFDCSAEEFATLHFPNPKKYSDGKTMFESLLKLSKFTANILEALLDRDIRLAESVQNSLKRHRKALLYLLANDAETLHEKHNFVINGEERAFRSDIFVFFGILQTQCCLIHDSAFKGVFESLCCGEGRLEPIKEYHLAPPNLMQRNISNYYLPDIIASLKWLEAKWLTIPYVSALPVYLDTLMARLAAICIIPQPEYVFGPISDYRKEIGANLYTHTQRLLEDCCWTFGPMFKKLFLYERVARSRNTDVAIRKESRKHIETLVVDNALEMGDKDMIGLFFKTYMKCGLRPSERNKYARDYPGKSISTPAVMEKLRGEDSKKRVMEHLNHAPWIIVRQKLFDKTTMDILFVLLIDAFVSNLTGIHWMDTFVEFNVRLMKEKSVEKYLDKTYPCIIQDFNNFNLRHQGRLFIHNSVAKCYIHWFDIMTKPPFNGRFQSRSLEPLKKYTPKLEQTLEPSSTF